MTTFPTRKNYRIGKSDLLILADGYYKGHKGNCKIKAINQHGLQEKIIADRYPATHAALSELKAKEILTQSTQLGTSKYLNNLIEQDHRRIKQRIYLMVGFKRFANAAMTISGIELAQKI